MNELIIGVLFCGMIAIVAIVCDVVEKIVKRKRSVYHENRKQAHKRKTQFNSYNRSTDCGYMRHGCVYVRNRRK